MPLNVKTFNIGDAFVDNEGRIATIVEVISLALYRCEVDLDVSFDADVQLPLYLEHSELLMHWTPIHCAWGMSD